MKPTQVQYKAFAVKTLKLAIELARAVYGIEGRPANLDVTMRTGRSFYRSGDGTLRLALGAYYGWTGSDGVSRYWEYDHLKADAEIGEGMMHWTDQVSALVAHEVAHWVQFTIPGDGRIVEAQARHDGKHIAIEAKADKGQGAFHGADWQSLYRDMRKMLCA